MKGPRVVTTCALLYVEDYGISYNADITELGSTYIINCAIGRFERPNNPTHIIPLGASYWRRSPSHQAHLYVIPKSELIITQERPQCSI